MEEAFPWTPPEHIAQLPPYVQGILITANDFHRGPVYSCPTCRERVWTRPHISYSKRAVVAAVAEARREHNPADGKGKGKADDKSRDDWAEFFGTFKDVR